MGELRTFNLAVLAITLGGCSTHYQPQPGPRLSVVMEGGSLAYSKNGQTISHGVFGGGLVEAVEDDPEALEAAETYVGRVTGGAISYTVGMVCGISAIAYAASSDRQSDGSLSDRQSAISAGGLICLLAGTITGSALLISGQPYHFDAINIYNDNLDRRYRGTPQPLRVTAPVPPPLPPQPTPPQQPPAQ